MRHTTMMYNKTQLYPEIAFKKHVFHRDMFAHYLRWTHVLKIAKIGMKVLDFGCGSGNLLEVLWRNMYKCERYLGLDIRPQSIKNTQEKFKQVSWAEFKSVDLCGEMDKLGDWDMITCFEVIEHIGKQNVDKFLQNIKKQMGEKTVLLLSTPNYNEKVGAAKNHMIDGEVGELSYDELGEALTGNGLYVEKTYGTFASQKDYKDKMSLAEQEVFSNLSQYYDNNILSVLFAPLFPVQSRNVLWKCKLG